MSGGGKMDGTSSNKPTKLTITITNLTPFQPFSPMFIMTHNDKIDPLFMFAQPPSAPLIALAENGDNSQLLALYPDTDRNIRESRSDMGIPHLQSQSYEVTVTDKFPYVTMASMFVNSNDGFIAINGRKLAKGMRFFLNGYDAGSEENTEDCVNIPGPACGTGAANTRATAGAEGFVHVHPGIQQIADLHTKPAADPAFRNTVDWRNPMAYVVVS